MEASSYTVISKSLAKILFVCLKTKPLFCRVPYTKNSNSAVNNKTKHFFTSIYWFKLKGIIDEPYRKKKIMKEIFYTTSCRIRHNPPITAGYRIQNINIKSVIKFSHHTVISAEGVKNFFFCIFKFILETIIKFFIFKILISLCFRKNLNRFRRFFLCGSRI